MHATAIAIDPIEKKYPLPSYKAPPVIGTLGSLDWRGIIEQLRSECNAVNIFHDAVGAGLALASLYSLALKATSQYPLFNLLITYRGKNKAKDAFLFEIDGEMPSEYNKFVAAALQNMIYEQVVDRTVFVVACAQYIETCAVKYLKDIKLNTYKDLFNKELARLHPNMFKRYHRLNITGAIPSSRRRLVFCLDSLSTHLKKATEPLVTHIEKIAKRLRKLSTNGATDPDINTLSDRAHALISRIWEIDAKNEEKKLIQFYCTSAFFSTRSDFIKTVMVCMLRTSLAQEILKVRTHRSLSSGTLSIYSLETNNLQFKYLLLFVLTFYEPSAKIIQDAYRNKLISYAQFDNILSSWTAMHKMNVVCSAFTMDERFIYFIRYICSDGTLQSFNENDKDYLYSVALYIDMLVYYRSLLEDLENATPNVIPGLQNYIETEICRADPLENGYLNLVDSELKFSYKNLDSVAWYKCLVDTKYKEFKSSKHSPTILHDSGSETRLSQEQNTLLFISHINAVISAAADASVARQNAAQAAELASKAARRAAAREQKKAKRLERAQKREEKREKLKKEEETAVRKSQKNRRKKLKKKQAACANAEKPNSGGEMAEESDDAEDNEDLSLSDTAEESTANSITPVPPSSSITPPPSLDQESPSSSGGLPAEGVPFQVMAYGESLLKLKQLLKDMKGLATCNIYLSVYFWMRNSNDPSISEKAYHCHDFIDFAAAFRTAKEMVRYFLVLVCKLPTQEYISLFAPATLYIADEDGGSIESGYFEIGGFYTGMQRSSHSPVRRFNLHHLRLSSARCCQPTHSSTDVAPASTTILMDCMSAAADTTKSRMLVSPLRGFFQDEKDIRPCQLISDSVSGTLYFVYYARPASGSNKIARILALTPLSEENTAHAQKWAMSKFKQFLDKWVNVDGAEAVYN